MHAICYINSTIQTTLSVLPGPIGANEALAAIPFQASQAVGAISASVVALGVIGGGIGLWKRNQAQQVPSETIQDKKASIELLQEGRLSLSQVPNLCNDFDAVLAAVQYDPFEIRNAGRHLRRAPEFREIALKAVEVHHSNQTTSSFINRIYQSLRLFRLGSLIEYLPEFLDDYEIMRILTLSEPSAIRYASGELYQDPRFRELVLDLVHQDAYLLQYAGDFRNDYEIVGHAIARQPSTLAYAGLDLRLRPEFSHLQQIAFRRTSYVIDEDHIVDPQISYQEAIALLHKNPNTTLEKEISSWSQEYQSYFPEDSFKKPVLSLEGDPNRVLKTFLQRVREVKDYRNGGEARANVTALVYRILRLAAENEEFQNKLIAILTQAETDCDDNVLIRLTDVEVLSHFYEKKLSDEQFRTLAIGAQRYEKLKEHVLSHHPGEEEIETLLNLLIELKHPLDLPFTMRSMGHANISKATAEDIKRATAAIESISDQELLSESEYWKERMSKSHKEQSDGIDNKYGSLMNELTEYFETDDAKQKDYLDRHENLSEWLLHAKAQGVQTEYSALAQFMMAEKDREIAEIH